MNYKELLISIYEKAINGNSYIPKLEPRILENIKIISEKCFTQKGVYTVFITLCIYKMVHPKQDIRNHQTQIKGGFSGRTIDTKYITPTLKELGLPSMAESGWLTRSLEQPYPYTLDYDGKISNKKVKRAFLELVDAIQNKMINPEYILVEFIKQIIYIQKANQVIIKPLKNPEQLTITKIIEVLNNQFSFHYNTFGGSKLPVLAFYAIYQIIINEISRYDACKLKNLGSHTASDKTSKSAGDIEILKKNELFEVIEIKLDKQIDVNMIRIAEEKIIKYNPKRYYLLSHFGINKEEIEMINNILKEVKKKHGCQIVINGVLPSLKYYLRLISDLDKFVNIYSKLIQNDQELKSIHKQKWSELVEELQNEL